MEELQTDRLEVAAQRALAEKAVKDPQDDKAKENVPRALILRMDAEDEEEVAQTDGSLEMMHKAIDAVKEQVGSGTDMNAAKMPNGAGT